MTRRIIIFLTAIALIAFAANSIFARFALAGDAGDAAFYTGVRLTSGALMLSVLLSAQRRHLPKLRVMGTFRARWAAPLALFVYAVCFSFAYVLLGAGMGALILFAAVQASMMIWTSIRGTYPQGREIIGLVVAMVAMAYLVSPGLGAPDIRGTFLMVVSGVAWAAYTLLGQASKDPLADTTRNFNYTVPLALILIGFGFIFETPDMDSLVPAIASGALASGLGYALWYKILPQLKVTQAAILQLTVPVIAAVAGVAFLGEPLSIRLMISSIAILGGVGFAIISRKRKT